MLSPIQIKQHFIHTVEFYTREEVDEEKDDHLEILLKSRKMSDHWQVLLGVKFGNENESSSIYHHGKVEIEGIFEVSTDFSEEKAQDLVHMNGGSILYGAVRELLMTLSSRSSQACFELPTLDARIFIDVAERTLENAATS